MATTDALCQAHLLGYPHCDAPTAGQLVRIWPGPKTADEMPVRMCRDCHGRFTDDTDGRDVA